MAERLLQPVQQPVVQVMEAGFSDQFVGFAPVNPVEIQAAPPAPASTFVQTPATIAPPQQQMAAVVEEPPAPPEEPVAPAPVEAVQPPPLPQPAPAPAPVRGPFLDRVGRFRDWLHRHFAATGIFLLDREGAVIFDESGHGKLHFLARSLAVASRRPGGAAANVHVKVGAAATLEVIPVDTPYGCLVLGAVVPSPLEPGAVAVVMEALKSVASPQA